MTRALAVALPPLAALALGACTVERVRDYPIVRADEVSLVVADDGPWREVADAAEGAAPELTATASAVPAAAVEAAPTPESALPAPARRTASAPTPRGTPVRSHQDLARERHLANPTRIRAQRITFRCPARYAGEVVKSAARTVEEAPGRFVLEGGAPRVACRELTLEADRIVLEVRRDGSDDVQVTARGAVSFVTVQREQVLREEGVRSLILTNDRVLPLR